MTTRTEGRIVKAVVAEFVGTALLLVAVVGSGIMGDRLAGGNVAIALLANSLATGAALVALILAFGPVSGAHFNPVVSLVDLSFGGLASPIAVSYVVAQFGGAVVGVGIADYMFEEPIYFMSHHVRGGLPQLLSEALATFGLIAVIWGTLRGQSSAVPFAVGAYITGAYWFTSSTSFANPAVTVARMLTDTFAGIRPQDVTGFVVAQATGASGAALLFRWLTPESRHIAEDVVVPHARAKFR